MCVDLWLHFAEGTFHAFHYLFGPFNTIESRYIYMYIFDVCVAAHTRVVGGGSSCCEMEPLSLLFEEQHVGILSLHVLQKLLKSNIKSTTRKCCEYPAVMPLGQTLLKWKMVKQFFTWNLQMIIILTANVVGVYLLWPDRKQVSDMLKGPTFSALCDVTLTGLVFALFQLWKITPNISFEEAVNSGLIYSVLWKSREFLQL